MSVPSIWGTGKDFCPNFFQPFLENSDRRSRDNGSLELILAFYKSPKMLILFPGGGSHIEGPCPLMTLELEKGRSGWLLCNFSRTIEQDSTREKFVERCLQEHEYLFIAKNAQCLQLVTSWFTPRIFSKTRAKTTQPPMLQHDWQSSQSGYLSSRKRVHLQVRLCGDKP